MKSRNAWSRVLGVVAGSLAFVAAAAAETVLLNVSYDPTRELYADYNKAFAALLEEEDRARTSRSASRTAARASRRAR